MPKLLFVNGSPHKNGSTMKVFSIMSTLAEEKGAECEIINISSKLESCLGCGFCKKNKKCVIDDQVNEFAPKFKEADGIFFGSPVHYASISGTLKSFLDRLYYSFGSTFAFKPVANVVVCRRSGGSAALDTLNKYAMINNQILVGSKYWNIVHGASDKDIEFDEEGVQTVKQLTLNMIALISKNYDFETLNEEKKWTNFVR